jgi:DtxR family Mn-dependent transcriptional regulator
MRGENIKFSEKAEEILEVLYILQVEEEKKIINLDEIRVENMDSAIKELIEIRYISVEEGRIILLEEGKDYARIIVRRHRLAERLMVDILQLKEELVNKTACQFEHLLQPEVEESICTLLGHPKVCPHQKPIPPGKCCIAAKKIVEPIIKPLTELKAGQTGSIAYLLTQDNKKLQKLISMGILPGMKIILLHKIPSYVFQVGHTQVAVDKEMADNIYVRIKI